MPLSTILTGFVDFALAMIPLTVVMVVTGVSPGLAIITLPLWLLAIGVVIAGGRTNLRHAQCPVP